ncbi:GPO family capsid scaffolding protein [Vibrio sp. JC009]|uniref:GPO family capsid scaffolding protein n=1 Tax=Vibrio sp. JC009 TaxID=2912314 RepID=UPI0023B12BA3|nr:GPO family capsid scaffolding protein [Vibrio sp. JC009]WED23514.1 GPO family capsid scaffolding protein [Vibrio sp. JC009]
MFQSEPICILQAGNTVDGRKVDQKVIDDIAETYSTDVYTARINEDHYKYSYKFGSVLSVEKRDDKLFAVLKPNSYLLNMVERGQLLHTSCEFMEDFAGTGKAYLTGLALTDDPASLATTQIHLSAKNGNSDKTYATTGNTIEARHFSNETDEKDSEGSLIKRFINLLKSAPDATDEQLSRQEEPEEMSKETEELLKQSIEQNKELNSNLGKLVEKLSAGDTPEEEETPNEPEPNQEVSELKGQVKELSSQMTELTEKLSKITDDNGRTLAGQDAEEEPYL